MKTLLAIDPGASGGMAVFNQDSKNPVWACGFADLTEADIINEFRALRIREESPYNEVTYNMPIAYLEELVKFAGPKLPGSTMAVYAASYGVIKGALLALGYEVRIIRAQKWQAALGLKRDRQMEKPDWKRKLKQRAQEIFPGIDVTLKTCDALLILEYARQDT